MPILKNLGPNVATMKFRVYLAIIDSEFAQKFFYRARIALTDPRRLSRAIRKRLSFTSPMEVQEPVSPKNLSTKTPLKKLTFQPLRCQSFLFTGRIAIT